MLPAISPASAAPSNKALAGSGTLAGAPIMSVKFWSGPVPQVHS
jgi:hypothetical protein